MKQVRETAVGKWFIFMKKGGMKSPNEFQLFWHGNNGRTRPLYTNFRAVSGYAILAEVWSQEIAEVWNQEIAEVRNQKIAEVWNQEVAGIGKSRTDEAVESRTCEVMRSDPRNSGVMDGGFGNQKEAKSKTLP
jgi:hypothetical protein